METVTVKRGNFDRQGNFDRSGSFVKVATVLIQSRSGFSLLVRLWKLTTDVWACAYLYVIMALFTL